MKSKKHYFEGRDRGYTVDELYKLNGQVVSKGTIYERLSQGRSFEEIVGNGSKPKQKRHKGKKLVEYKGKEYTLDELLQFAVEGVTRIMLNIRLLRNWNVEKALTTGGDRNTRRRHATLYKYKGKEYSVKELMEICTYKVSEKTLRDRLTEYSVEVVLNCPESFKRKIMTEDEKKIRHRENVKRYRDKQKCLKSHT